MKKEGHVHIPSALYTVIAKKVEAWLSSYQKYSRYDGYIALG